MTIWPYLLFAVCMMMFLPILEDGVQEIRKGWKKVGEMGYQRTPFNLALYFYCQYEAAIYINMEAMKEMFANWKKK